MKILITGATGFIGGYLTKMLIQEGYEVKTLVRPSSDMTGLKALDIEIIQGDIQDLDCLETAMKGCQQVYHGAAARTKAKIPKKTYYLVNVEGSSNIAQTAIKTGVERLVYFSTVGVYGMPKQVKVDENTPPRPNTYYRTTKLLAEQVFLSAHQQTGLPVVIARLSGVSGPGSLSWVGLVKAIATGNFRLIGSGDNYYHLGNLTDIVEGLRLCGEKTNIEGKIYNIAGKEPIKVKTLVKIMAENFKVDYTEQKLLPVLPYQTFNTMTEWVYHTFGRQLPGHHRYDMFLTNRNIDISKAMAELNYCPQVSSEETVQQLISWYQEKGYV